jgi:transcription initiation factor TFIIIB Brf1 subunit/transcription initiation factor TFIIB
MCDHLPESIVLDKSSATTVCTACGLVLDSIYFEEDTTESCTQPTIEAQEGIGKKFREDIGLICRYMSLGDGVVSTAIQIASAAHSVSRCSVRNHTPLQGAAAAVYFACIALHFDRSEREFVDTCSGLTSKAMAVGTKHMRRALLKTSEYHHLTQRALSAKQLIPRYIDVIFTVCDDVPMLPDKNSIRKRSEDIASRVEYDGLLEGRSAVCKSVSYICRALLDLGCSRSIIKKVSACCGLTPVTITQALMHI